MKKINYWKLLFQKKKLDENLITLNKENDNLIIDINKIKLELLQKTNELNRLNEAITEKETKNTQLQNRIAELEKESKKLREERISQNTQIDLLNSTLSTARDHLKGMKDYNFV